MVKKPTLDIPDEVTRLHVESLQEETQQNVIELSAAPTAAAPLLQDREIGSYSNILYMRVSSKIFVITPSSIITIT